MHVWIVRRRYFDFGFNITLLLLACVCGFAWSLVFWGCFPFLCHVRSSDVPAKLFWSQRTALRTNGQSLLAWVKELIILCLTTRIPYCGIFNWLLELGTQAQEMVQVESIHSVFVSDWHSTSIVSELNCNYIPCYRSQSQQLTQWWYQARKQSSTTEPKHLQKVHLKMILH